MIFLSQILGLFHFNVYRLIDAVGREPTDFVVRDAQSFEPTFEKKSMDGSIFKFFDVRKKGKTGPVAEGERKKRKTE